MLYLVRDGRLDIMRSRYYNPGGNIDKVFIDTLELPQKPTRIPCKIGVDEKIEIGEVLLPRMESRYLGNRQYSVPVRGWRDASTHPYILGIEYEGNGVVLIDCHSKVVLETEQPKWAGITRDMAILSAIRKEIEALKKNHDHIERYQAQVVKDAQKRLEETIKAQEEVLKTSEKLNNMRFKALKKFESTIGRK